VDEVMSLEEPYRRVLLLRWFDEREPKEIAALLGMSAGTVRSQLKRGLERLRDRLDRRFGDRKTWIGAFVPIAFGRPARIAATGGGALTGGLLMSLKSNSLLPLLIVLVLGGVITASIAAMSTHPESANENPEIVYAAENRTLEDEVPPRRDAVLFGRPARQRRGPGGLTARVARVDSGEAVAGVHILLSGRSLADEDVQVRTTTNVEGRFHWAQLPAGDAYVLSVEGEGLPPLGLRSIAVTAGRTDDLGTLWLGTPGALEGRVVDAANRPVRGARVRVRMTAGASWDFMTQIHEAFSALDREPAPEAAATTDRDGRFQFEALPPGIVSVTASAPGHLAAHASAAVVPGAPSAALTIRLATGREVTGTVVDENGLPLVGARVASVPSQMDLDAVMYGRCFTSSDAEGHFRLASVERGEKLILIAAYAGRPAVMSELAPDANDVTLIIRGGTTLDVCVLAADGQTPVPDAKVMVVVAPTSDFLGRDAKTFLVGRTDARGSIVFDAWPGHIQMAVLSHPDHATGIWAGMLGASGAPGIAKGPESSKLESGRQRVEFTLPHGSVVRGRILDPQGRGIAGASVRALRFGLPDTGGVRSDDTGGYHLVMPFGSTLRVEAPGFAQSPKSSLAITDPKPGEPIEHDVAMQEAAVVTGRVLLPDGSPAAGAIVRLRSAGAARPGLPFETERQVFARADGRFLMDSVAAGDKWHALARLPGFVDGMAGPFVVGTSGQATSPNVLLIAGVALEVTVRDEFGNALPDVTVSVVDKRSIRLEWDPMDLEDPSSMTNADGMATVGPVAPGRHELHVSAGGYVPVSKHVEIHAGDLVPVRQSVTLSRGRMINGRVLDADGKPIEGARVTAVSDASPSHTVLATTDVSGRYEAAGLAPGTVNLEARAEGYRVASQSLAEGEEAIDVTLTRVDPTVAARRAELEAERKAIRGRLMSTDDKVAKQALIEDLGRIGQALRELGED
jgi:protocatechuate 3,4-dioxygenase beta subunit